MNEIREKFLKGIGLSFSFLLILLLFSRLGFSLPLNIQSVVTNKNEVFTTIGEGRVIVIPDIAYINLGIEASGKTVFEVKKKINQVNDQLIKVLDQLGINKKDIKTENYSLTPQYDWLDNRQRIIGYQATTTLKVKVKPLEKINQVIDEATKVGVNNIYGVNFDVENKEKYLSQARQQAVAEAKRKAREAALSTGFRLGKIIAYSENTISPTIYPLYLGGGEAKFSQEDQTNLQPGSQEIKITVSLGYEIR